MNKFSTLQIREIALKKIVVLVAFVFSTTFLFSQNGVIKGKIIDTNGNEPLIGAAVMIKGTTLGSATDFDGNYTISGVKPGKYTLVTSYISYKPFTKENIVVDAGKETVVDIQLESANISLKEVELVAKSNKESENILLMEQKQSLLATQAVGAKEMSRKGISNAEAAVAQVSGVSKQDGVKNVFVRGLGDRYNFTTLNGFPIPSEDPEYKNISLDFFGSDIIQNIGVKKVFSSSNYSDVGGAVIDISSKELVGDKDLNVDLSAGFNPQIVGSDFLQMDGVNYWGTSTNIQPGKDNFKTVYNYGNSLDPHSVNLPLNYSYGFSGGKNYKIGKNSDPLSFYVVASYSTGFSFTKEKIYDTTTSGVVYKDMDGEKSSQNINQLLLGNLNYLLNHKHQFSYNFMLVHDNSQYVGDFTGTDYTFTDNFNYMGFMRRQQSNDNMLLVNQLLSTIKLNETGKLEAGLSFNTVKGTEPDRRVDKLARKNDTEYQLYSGDGEHVRNFAQLKENDLNGRLIYTRELPKKFKSDNSVLSIGYNGRYLTDNFDAAEYSMNASGYLESSSLANLKLDDWFNQTNLTANKFSPYGARISYYTVTKFINSGYINLDYQLSQKLAGNIGIRAEQVNLNIVYDVVGGSGRESSSLNPFYLLPGLNLKYNVNDKNTLRLGLSKSYTLPQSKEISPYLILGLSFSSEGNPDLKPSDNYNADLKWDYYLSPSELISLNGFYKYIKKPIARVYEASAAGYFTYDNISDHASVAGLEMEIRKNIINKVNSNIEKVNKLSAGLNASYIYSNMKVNVRGTAEKNSSLEGAAPFIVNFDISYNYSHKNTAIVNSLVLNYYSDRVYSIGLVGFEDVIEKSIPTLNFVSEYKMNKHFSLKFKAKNILDPTFELTRNASDGSGNKVLNSYKKGVDVSLGMSYNFN